MTKGQRCLPGGCVAALFYTSGVDGHHLHQVDLRLYFQGCVEAALFILRDGSGQTDAGRHVELPAPQILTGAAAQGNGQRDGGMARADAAGAITDLYSDGNRHPKKLLTAFADLLPGSLAGDDSAQSGMSSTHSV